MGDPAKLISKTVEAEVSALESCDPKECPVFFVRALGRTFPIPKRFMLSKPSDADPLSRIFMSPIPAFSSVESAASGRELTGMIAIGSLHSLRESEERGNLILRKVRVIDGVVLSTVTISGDSSRISRPGMVVLIGEVDYVMIGDFNTELPDLLLGISRRIDEKATSPR